MKITQTINSKDYTKSLRHFDCFNCAGCSDNHQEWLDMFFTMYDDHDSLIGYICPNCAGQRVKEARESEYPRLVPE